MDKFYTSEFAVDLVMDAFKKHVEVLPEDVIVEPSAGDGSFLKKIVHPNTIALDIEPEHDDVIKQDFLAFVPHRGRIHVLGNPPFGKNGSMALKFIKKSHEFAETIAFILPRSFKKESIQMRIPRDLELVFEMDLPKNSFRYEQKPYDVPCVFQIWKKSSSKRLYDVLVPNRFSFVKKSDDHDFAIRRVGGGAGKVTFDTVNTNASCFYYIKVHDELKIVDIDVVEKDYSTGPRSLSKREVIRFLNSV